LKKKRYLGIDAGSYALKIVQAIATRKGETVLEKTAYLPWSEMDEKKRSNFRFLKDILKTCSIQKGYVCSAIDDPSLIVRRMAMPEMPEKDLQEALKWKLRKELGPEAEEVIVDTLSLEKEQQPEGGLQEFIVFGINKKILEGHVDILQGAGLKPVSVEPSSTGILHLFDYCPELTSEKVFFLLDIGASHTELTLVQDSKPLFVRSIPFSGEQLTASLQEACGMEADAAEQWKQQYGIEEVPDPEPDFKRIQDVLAQRVEEFLMEIRFSLGYFQDNVPFDISRGEIFLTGGSAGMPGLIAAIQGEFDLPCRSFPDFSGLGLEVSNHYKDYGHTVPSSSLATALGLALREINP